MADGAASVPLLLGAGLLVGAVYEAAVGFVTIRIDEDAETSAVLAEPAKRLVIVLALALAASLLAEQLAVDEGVADLVGVGITTNWGTLRWARNLVVLTAADPSPQRLEDQLSTVALSRSGRHVVAETSDHWIPLEEAELVVQAIRDVVALVRA